MRATVQVDIIENAIPAVQAQGFEVHVLESYGPAGGNPVVAVTGELEAVRTWLTAEEYGEMFVNVHTMLHNS